MTITEVQTGNDAATITALGLFDEQWYLSSYPDVRAAGLNGLTHWCDFGWQESRNPNPYFDTEWYLSQNPDVVAARFNPLVHYGLFGDPEGRRPTQCFDPTWYRQAYGLLADKPALRHFLLNRATGSYAPCPEFYAVPHLSRFKSEAIAGRDPFLRALRDAKAAGRELRPDQVVIAASKLLDANFYLINGTDVHESELDPIDHFCRFGWREARKPNIYFDISWYIQTNPDVSRLRINPLVHYIVQGEAKGRRPIVYFDPTWYRTTYELDPDESPLGHFLSHRRSQRYSPNAEFDVQWYLAQYGPRVGPNRDPFAHYLQAGTLGNLNPSPLFDAARYRRTHLGRPSRAFRHLIHPETHNPLVHYLLSTYS